MPRRIIDVDGVQWEVAGSGRNTQYTKDEFGLRFAIELGSTIEVCLQHRPRLVAPLLGSVLSEFDDVPDSFREEVAEYYRSLAKTPQTPQK